jgi:hypothetical protein
LKKKRKEHLKFYPNDGIRHRLGPSGPFAGFRGIAVGVAVAAVGVDGVVVERWWRGVRGGGIDEGGGGGGGASKARQSERTNMCKHINDR